MFPNCNPNSTIRVADRRFTPFTKNNNIIYGKIYKYFLTVSSKGKGNE
jgi:hypothetical protein